CRMALVRQMLGRIVGETHDARGMRGFVNTLQTREQHIRREKATSNICTNEAIAAITAAVYLGLMGPEGLRAAARLGVAKAHALAHRLGALPGCSVSTDGDFFDRFALRVPRLAAGREGRNAEREPVEEIAVGRDGASRQRAESVRERVRLGDAETRGRAQTFRSHEPEVDRRGDRRDRLVRADVARGLFAADVLLSSLQRVDEPAHPARVVSLAYDAARHLTNERHAAC